MDCMPESAARSLVRIECILLQGAFNGFLNLFICLFILPSIPIMYILKRISVERGSNGLIKMSLMIPVWIMNGIMVMVSMPFVIVCDTMISMYGVARSEWKNRWRAGKPKRPDGKPIEPMTEYEERLLENAITMSVIRDYGQEKEE